MSDRLDLRDLAHSVVPIVVAGSLLATASLWQPQVSPGARGGSWPLPALFAIATAAALYTPWGRRTVGLGAVAAAPALWLFGVSSAGWVMGIALLLRELLRRYVLDLPTRGAASQGLLPVVADAARASLAMVVAGGVWVLAGADRAGTDYPHLFAQWGLVTLSTYVVTLLGLHAIERHRLGTAGRGQLARVARASLLDAGGWLIGGLAAQVVVKLGWTQALLLLLSVALLAAEAARQHHLRRRAVARVGELWEVTRAGHRIIFRDPDLANMAGHVLEECRRVLPLHWFQFELLEGGEEQSSWYAGPDGHLEEGTPEPSDSPPALPGIHRRSTWKVLQRHLHGDGEIIARLRFWCDPRRLEPTSVELLDSLLPQIAASVHRALLDRRAKQDPLTGLADRRVLESRLEQVYAATHMEGGSMAVIMCDLDRFKKINDTHGHDVGDRALLQVVEVLEEFRRDSDLCSRYGGEEFALVLEKTDGATALRVAERLRMEMERRRFMVDGTRVALRLSAGVAAYPELQVKAGKDLLVLADEALIEAKRRGRNRSLLHQGRGRFRTAGGKVLTDQEERREPEAPTLFA